MEQETYRIHIDGKRILGGLPNPFSAIRYHSLAVMRHELPDCLEVSAWTPEGMIMTEVGKDLLKNFLSSHTVSTIRGATTCQL